MKVRYHELIVGRGLVIRFTNNGSPYRRAAPLALLDQANTATAIMPSTIITRPPTSIGTKLLPEPGPAGATTITFLLPFSPVMAFSCRLQPTCKRCSAASASTMSRPQRNRACICGRLSLAKNGGRDVADCSTQQEGFLTEDGHPASRIASCRNLWPLLSRTPCRPAIPSSRLSAIRRARSTKCASALGGQISRTVASNRASQRSK